MSNVNVEVKTVLDGLRILGWTINEEEQSATSPLYDPSSTLGDYDYNLLITTGFIKDLELLQFKVYPLKREAEYIHVDKATLEVLQVWDIDYMDYDTAIEEFLYNKLIVETYSPLEYSTLYPKFTYEDIIDDDNKQNYYIELIKLTKPYKSLLTLGEYQEGSVFIISVSEKDFLNGSQRKDFTYIQNEVFEQFNNNASPELKEKFLTDYLNNNNIL